jgi:hypothetical protein
MALLVAGGSDVNAADAFGVGPLLRCVRCWRARASAAPSAGSDGAALVRGAGACVAALLAAGLMASRGTALDVTWRDALDDDGDGDASPASPASLLGPSVLHLCADSAAFVSILPALVRAGADVNAAAGADGLSPLHVAVGARLGGGRGAPQPRVVEALLRLGAQPNSRSWVTRATPLHVVLGAEGARADVARTVGLLAAFGARADVEGAGGATPLDAARGVDRAAGSEGAPTLEALLASGAASWAARTAPPSAAALRLADVPGCAYGGVVVLQSFTAGAAVALLDSVPHVSVPVTHPGLSLPVSTAQRPAVRLPSNEECTASATGAGADPWLVPDAAAAACLVCAAAFGLLRRRHHCRSCHTVTCHACSLKSFPMLAPGASAPAPQRVCDGCFNRLCADADAAAAAVAGRAAERETARRAGAAAAAAADEAKEQKRQARASLLGGGASSGAGSGAGAGPGTGAGVKGGLADAAEAAAQARDKLVERGERLSRMEERTQQLSDSAGTFSSLARQLAEQQKSRWW